MKLLNPKVLIIDDDPVYLAVMEKQFKNEGFQNVAIFESAIEGLKSDFGRPDLVFVDFHMNDINGARASKMFSKKWKNTRIVLISNSDSIKKKVKKSRYGIDDTVLKEADFSEFLNQVKIAMRGIIVRGIFRVSAVILISVALYFLFIY
ncbi:MAG: Transcriptional regulatory protein ZraR [Bacteroidota bacterium]|jgi:DNA-binding response OmpR family regulator